MTPDDLTTTELLKTEFAKLTYEPPFVPRGKTVARKRLLISIPAVAASIAAAVALTLYNPLAETPAGWAATPNAERTLGDGDTNSLCADRAIATMPVQWLPDTKDEVEQWLSGFHVLTDERGDHALSLYDTDGADYAAVCVLTQGESGWQADFFATRSHKGFMHLSWADVITLPDGERLAFVTGWKNFDEKVGIKFGEQEGETSMTRNYFSIWLPTDTTCRTVNVVHKASDYRIGHLVDFGGADGISSDVGACQADQTQD